MMGKNSHVNPRKQHFLSVQKTTTEIYFKYQELWIYTQESTPVWKKLKNIKIKQEKNEGRKLTKEDTQVWN